MVPITLIFAKLLTPFAACYATGTLQAILAPLFLFFWAHDSYRGPFLAEISSRNLFFTAGISYRGPFSRGSWLGLMRASFEVKS